MASTHRTHQRSLPEAHRSICTRDGEASGLTNQDRTTCVHGLSQGPIKAKTTAKANAQASFQAIVHAPHGHVRQGSNDG
eukprot:1150715-Rhodomonas_salina.1